MSGKIHLVGAGLAGSLLSLFLARRGFEVEIFERRVDMRRESISAGRSINLALAHRGIVALRAVGIYPQIERLTIPMKGRLLHDLQGNLNFQRYGKIDSEVIYSISRGALNAALLSAAEATGKVTIQFKQRCTHVDLKRKIATFQSENRSETEVNYDQLIGTDGSASAVRDSLVKQAGIQFSEDVLDHGYKELTIPPDDFSKGFRMDKNALHIWPRGEYMLIALPNLDSSFTATLFLPHKDGFDRLTTPPAVRGFFQNEFPDSLPMIPYLEEEFLSRPTGMLTTVRCSPWSHEDQVLLLGDAAHAIVPFHGQGMNCAFEDCLSLDAQLEKSNGDWRTAFQSFEKDRMRNANAIADLALENYVEMRDTVRDPKFHLKKHLEWSLEERHGERFIPRYSMIMFHSIPYADVKERGEIQTEILNRLTANADTLEQVDLDAAGKLVQERLKLF